MESERRCPQCARKIPWGQAKCPFCQSEGSYFWSLRRDAFLLIIVALLLVMFSLTGFVVKSYVELQKSLAEEWYARGEEDLRAKRLTAALAEFRTALSYSHNNPQYELRLAQALMQVTDSEEARSEARTYLLSLLEREPGNGLVNLELARLTARAHDTSGALLYYHGAIYGAWPGDQGARRREARLELVEYLLGAGQRDAARGELIAVATALPPDADLQTKVGYLLLRVKGYDDALKLFRQALLERPNFPAALAGAGECHFQNGDFARAERYLMRAVQQDPHLERAVVMLDSAQGVLNLDPFNPRLGSSERARRAVLAFNAALTRLENCAAAKRIDLKAGGQDPLQVLYVRATGLQPHARQAVLSRDPELLTQVMDEAFEIEQTTERTCREPQGQDLVLLLLARHQGGARP